MFAKNITSKETWRLERYWHNTDISKDLRFYRGEAESGQHKQENFHCSQRDHCQSLERKNQRINDEHWLRQKDRGKNKIMSVYERDDCNNSTMTWEILKSRQIDGPKYGRGGEIYVQTNQAWQYTSVTSVQPITSRQGKTKRNVNPPLSMSLLW